MRLSPGHEMMDKMRRQMRGRLVKVVALICAGCLAFEPIRISIWTFPLRTTVETEALAVQIGWQRTAQGWVCPACRAQGQRRIAA